MKKIKTLLIGESPFEHKEYRNLKYSELNINCDFTEIAFIPIPKSNVNYDVTTIKSYKRFLGLLNKKLIDDNNKYTFHNNRNNLIIQLANNDIYLVNSTELKKLNFKDKYSNYISDKTNIICFGKEAFKYINSIPLTKNIYHCPHPSGHVHHNFWDVYNIDLNNYAKPSSIEQLF